jgi:hypothetical protein
VKKTIKVPAISSKQAEIPPDDYSWRKYGQKPIKGSPHPRSKSFLSISSLTGAELTIAERQIMWCSSCWETSSIP